MEFQSSITDLIKNRKSTRTFDGCKLEPAAKEDFLAYLETLNREIDSKARFVYVEMSSQGGRKKLGTYGFISGASQYLVAVANREETNPMKLGYAFEKGILRALDLGIQSCWLGGTFSREDFGKASGTMEHEFIPIVSPLGYEREKRRFFETSMRKAVGAEKRKPWEELFHDMDKGTPLAKEAAGDYAQVLEMVRLGPSASNRQPWRVVKEGDKYHLFVQRTKGYALGNYDLQLNDMGIAKCHFDLTARELGLKGEWKKEEPAPVWNGLEYVETWVMVP